MFDKRDLIFLLDEDLFLAYLKHKRHLAEKGRQFSRSYSVASTPAFVKEKVVVKRSPGKYTEKVSVSVRVSPKMTPKMTPRTTPRLSPQVSKKLEMLPPVTPVNLPDVSRMVSPLDSLKLSSLSSSQNAVATSLPPISSLSPTASRLPSAPLSSSTPTRVIEGVFVDGKFLEKAPESVVQLPALSPSRAGSVLPPLSPSTSVRAANSLPVLPPSPTRILPISGQLSPLPALSTSSIPMSRPLPPLSPAPASRTKLPTLSKLTVLK